MLKLYLYGYQHGIRSSRKLEAETRRNLEVIWLVKGLRPSYKSIADFRKDHVVQLREVNRDFILLCREFSLFGGENVAVDGCFFKGDASRASIKTEAYIDKALEEINRKVEEYQQALEEGREALKSDDPGKIDLATEKITAVSHKLAELMYKKQQEEASQGTGEGEQEGPASEQGNSTSGDDVIDAEFTEQK